MFTDKIQRKDFQKMKLEYKDLLVRDLTIPSDCEIGGPRLYVAKMLPAAASKIDQLIVARTAASEGAKIGGQRRLMTAKKSWMESWRQSLRLEKLQATT